MIWNLTLLVDALNVLTEKCQYCLVEASPNMRSECLCAVPLFRHQIDRTKKVYSAFEHIEKLVRSGDEKHQTTGCQCSWRCSASNDGMECVERGNVTYEHRFDGQKGKAEDAGTRCNILSRGNIKRV
jgi:hypothetical protein